MKAAQITNISNPTHINTPTITHVPLVKATPDRPSSQAKSSLSTPNTKHTHLPGRVSCPEANRLKRNRSLPVPSARGRPEHPVEVVMRRPPVHAQGLPK